MSKSATQAETKNEKPDQPPTKKSPLTDVAEKVALRRYYQKDEEGNSIEDWEGLTHRVVEHVCKNESEDYKKNIFDLIYNTKFLPNSPCLVNSGNNISGLCACFCSPPVQDSWVGMMKNLEIFGHVARRGGGNGVCFSEIRPEGDPVFGSTHAKACGPIEHMRMVSEVMSSITQAGFRGMANLGSLHVHHPDIKKFIVCKQHERALKTLLKEDIFNHYEQIKENTHNHLNIVLDKFIHNFNISVLVTDEFMEKVKNDEDFNLTFKGKVYETVKARELFDLIVENAWKNGDPGLLFDDRINDGPYKYSGQKITTANPCGEQVLPSRQSTERCKSSNSKDLEGADGWRGGTCNLGSIDISKFYDAEKKDLDWKELRKTIHVCVRFLDNVIDANKFPTKEFELWAKENRPVGLGIMGFADLLLKLRLTYGSSKSLEFAEKLAKFLEDEAHKESVKLAKERGTPKCCKYDDLDHRRNVTLTSIAPTGSISLLAGCSSSIEPIFSPVIYRYDNTGAYEIPHPDSDKAHFRCAVDSEGKGREVHWKQHVKIQAAFQKYCSAAISKTINLSNSATQQDIADAYMLAWELGNKGVTVYRDGSKTAQVLNTSEKPNARYNSPQERPKEVPCDIHKTTAEGINWHLIVGKVDGPYEIFAVNGKQSLPDQGVVVKRRNRHYSLVSDEGETLIENIIDEEKSIDPLIAHETRRFSLELRNNIHPKEIVGQINKTNTHISSFQKASCRVMRKYLSQEDQQASEICSECVKEGRGNGKMIYESGCMRCLVCNISKCG